MELNCLNLFYQSCIGKTARHIIGSCIGTMLKKDKDITILGVGYANPYLRRFFPITDTVMAITPPYIGMVRWPRLENNRCIMADEDHYPLQNNSIDVAVLVHALEFAESPWAMLAEVNRVLPIGGRVIVVVPNRVGMWARKSSMPFGHGRPFTSGQLKNLMRSAGFDKVSHQYKLFFPPFSIFSSSKIAIFCERWVGFFMRENSGVIVAQYEKKAMQSIAVKSESVFKLKQTGQQQPVLPRV